MPLPHRLHGFVRQGNLPGVRTLLDKTDINAYDSAGQTPLMYAASSPKANVEMLRLLLNRGADIHLTSRSPYEAGRSLISLAISGGDPPKVAALIEHGADAHYRNALIDALYGRDLLRDRNLIDLLKLLIASGVELNTVASYGETAGRTLARLGRFDAVKLLLDAGADEASLRWTPLMRAVALGSLADVAREVESGAAPDEATWLMAVQTGDVAKAKLLLKHGAPRDGPALFHAVERHHGPMLTWLLEIGTDVEQVDDLGMTALMKAVQSDNAEAVNALLDAGADVHVETREQTALEFVRTREIAIRLLDVGADPARLPFEGRRALLGFDPDPDEALLDVPAGEFHAGRSPRFGAHNPETMIAPFWEAMIRSGISAYEASAKYGNRQSPVWCAQRFGQSITRLPDGRIVQIGGEHEDFYDADFHIYNDVFVHEPDGTIHIFGYPESVFPPTDFHTATLIGEDIFIIGSLGNHGRRQYGTTPMHRLNTASFRIEPIETRGEAPGWIYKHRAVQTSAHEIRVSGGTVVTRDGDQEIHAANEGSFVFDTARMLWRLAVSEPIG